MTQPYRKIQVLIADDHELVREGLRTMMAKSTELEIIAEAGDGEELERLARQYVPDVILTDVKMPKQGGVEATRNIREAFPHIGIIALSTYDEESLVLDMIRAGVNGYLMKNAGTQELTAAIKAAYRGESYYCKQINAQLARIIARGGQLKKKPWELFNERELQIIDMMCEGKSSKLIAEALSLKTRTVERYREAIMEKMNVKNATAVVAYAITNGIYPPKLRN